MPNIIDLRKKLRETADSKEEATLREQIEAEMEKRGDKEDWMKEEFQDEQPADTDTLLYALTIAQDEGDTETADKIKQQLGTNNENTTNEQDNG